MEPESLIEKLDRERRELRLQRQNESRTQRVVRQLETGARPTSKARREEASQRFKELMSPSQPAARPSTPQDVSGATTEFYTFKAGEVGIIKILTEGDFTAL